jgi:aspartate kinase
MKFGGTSVQDAQAVSNVVNIVKSRLAEKPVVVISAIAQATNMLEKAGQTAAEGRESEAKTLLAKLSERHHKMIDALIKNDQQLLGLRKTIASSFNELETLVKGIATLLELTPRTHDALCCYGELLSSRIVAAALSEVGIQSEWLDTKDFMVTDDNYNSALPYMDIVEKKLNDLAMPAIKQGKVPVTQGYIGITQSGRRTTMGRESSDYSASIIGAALNASEVQIWTDVDGVLTADPKIVESPRKIDSLSFEEAYELSYFGAQVLHPNTMLPAIEKNIPIHINNSKKPNLSGTLVTSNIVSKEAKVKSIAHKYNIVILNVIPRKRYNQFIFWEHIYGILAKYNVLVRITATSEYSASIVLDFNQHIDAISNELGEIGVVSIIKKKGILSVVGSNICKVPNIMNRIFSSLSNIGLTMISFGAAKSSISLILDDADIVDAVQKLHADFFDGATIDE